MGSLTTEAQFNWYTSRRYPHPTLLYVTMPRSGRMRFSKGALDKMGNPPAVQFGMSEDGTQLAVRAAEQGQNGALTVHQKTRRVSAAGMLANWGLVVDENRLYRLNPIGNGMLALTIAESTTYQGRTGPTESRGYADYKPNATPPPPQPPDPAQTNPGAVRSGVDPQTAYTSGAVHNDMGLGAG